MTNKANESAFQNDMINQLVANGRLLGKLEKYNRKLALYEEDVLVSRGKDGHGRDLCPSYGSYIVL